MLSINTIARVIVNTVRTSASPTSFNIVVFFLLSG